MNKAHLKIVSATSAALCLFLFSQVTFAGVVVVVNPASGISSITDQQASRVFLGKVKKVNGKELVAVDQNEGSKSRETFYSTVVKKSEAKLKAYWSTKIFSGKGTPPKSLASDDDVKAWVAANANAIGYVDNAKVDGSLVVVYTVK